MPGTLITQVGGKRGMTPEDGKMSKHFTKIAIAAALVCQAHIANAQAVLKLAVGAPGSWETSIPAIGQKAGIFAKHGLELSLLQSQGGGETIQAVVSGSVDIGIGTGFPGVLSAFSKGAPIRIIGNECTGASEFWYAAATSPFKDLKNPDIRSISYSTFGSSTHAIARGLAKQYGSKAQLVATGGPSVTLTQVMSGQIDIGWSSPPLGLKELEEGKIRLVARGSELPGMDNQTIRVITANANVVKNRADDLKRFIAAYRETVEWMYSDPKALELYAGIAKTTVGIAKKVRDEFVEKRMLLPERTDGFESGMADAVEFKYLSAPLPKNMLNELIQIPALPK
jgi:NitT/TauT family transport system substrate-binding protein